MQLFCFDKGLYIYLSYTFLNDDTSFLVEFITCVFVFRSFIFIPTIFIILSTWLLELLMHLSFLSRFNTDTSVIHVFFLWVFKSLISLFHQFEFLLCFVWFIMIRMKLSCWFMNYFYLFSKIEILILFV